MTHAGRIDACPGVLELHVSADGQLARVRIPGGFLSAASLEVLGSLTATCASGWVELTSRGNVGFRSVTSARELRSGLAAAGLLASESAHDRARNIIASPLTGLSGALDGHPVVASLDAGLQASPGLAELSGRFAFGVDDGSGLSETPDLGLVHLGDEWQLTIDGWLAGPASVTDAMAAAVAFLGLRGDDVGVWRVRELGDGAAALAASLGRVLGARRSPISERLPLGETHVGEQRLMIVSAWLQRLSAAQLQTLASALTPGETVRLTAAGRIVVPVSSVVDVGVLAAAGFIVDTDDPRAQVTTCPGLGACARATVDVRGLAASFAVAGAEPVHLVSCARACGTPADARVEVRWV